MYITFNQFHIANASNYGYCTSCNQMTEDFHEPDAQNYECEHCGAHTSMGIEWAMVCDELTFVDSLDDVPDDAVNICPLQDDAVHSVLERESKAWLEKWLPKR